MAAFAARRSVPQQDLSLPALLDRGPEGGRLPPTLSLRPTPRQGGGELPVAWQAGIPLPSFDAQDRPRLDLAGSWRKQRAEIDTWMSLDSRGGGGLAALEAEAAGRHGSDYDDSSWETKTLPMVENEMPSVPNDPDGPEHYEDGVWYRRSFDVPRAWQGQAVTLYALSMSYVADVWVNGQWVGCHEGGYTPFALDVAAALRYDVPNIIALRIDNPPWATRQDTVPALKGDWWNYTGVIHDIYLEAAPLLHIVRADVLTPDLSGRVQITALLHNRSLQAQTGTLQLGLRAADRQSAGWLNDPRASAIAGAALGEAARFEVQVPAGEALVLQADMLVPDPQLWSPADPTLYVLEATLASAGGNDQVMYQFGIRTVTTQGYRLLLNDAPTFLAGLARHEEWPDSGRTAHWDRIRADLEQIRDLGANFVRTAHYPNHVHTYTLSDRIGLLAAVEIPLWQYTAVEFAAQDKRRIADQMWREMILSNRNRPSIIFWSANNEPFDNTTSRIPYLERLKDDYRSNYDDGRLMIQSAAADRPGPDDPSQALLDVAGWTMYFGIFHGSTPYEGTQNFLTLAHAANPARPLLNTEYGIWSAGNSSEAYQEEIFRETFAALVERTALDANGEVNPEGYLAGIVWWTVFDWYTIFAGLQTMGLYKMDRSSAKPVAQLLIDAYRPWALKGGE